MEADVKTMPLTDVLGKLDARSHSMVKQNARLGGLPAVAILAFSAAMSALAADSVHAQSGVPFQITELLDACVSKVRSTATTSSAATQAVKHLSGSTGFQTTRGNVVVFAKESPARECIIFPNVVGQGDVVRWGDVREDIDTWSASLASVSVTSRDPRDKTALGWCAEPFAVASAGANGLELGGPARARFPNQKEADEAQFLFIMSATDTNPCDPLNRS